MQDFLDKYRRRLNNYDYVLAYALLGLFGGVGSGLIVLAFELAINEASLLWGVRQQVEGFAALPQWARLALPVGGALVLGLAYSLLRAQDRETGIVHVLSRMHSHYGVLPLRNALVQFVGGVFALATGQSGGREGPGVHLGAAVNSLLGQWLRLPNNSLRMLIACGTAGSISAAFQTPLAGVIFAMEVIVAEYTVAGFIPVILAAVSAFVVSRTLSDNAGLFSLPSLELNSLLELPLITLLGLACGVAVAAFIRISDYAAGFSHRPVVLRFCVAGLLTGSLGVWVPQILGIGYGSLELALNNELALSMLLLLILCKLVATAVSCGVGMPVGLIGPNLIIGACIGGVVGMAGGALSPELASNPQLYVVIGMGAAMGAVLNAPLAAMLAVIELTQSVGIGMAAMLAIVAATLTNVGIFGQQAAHQTMLRRMQRIVPNDPLSQYLHRINVGSIMDSRVVRVPASFPITDLPLLLEATPAWCLVERESEALYTVRGDKLLEWLKAAPEDAATLELTEANIRRWSVAALPLEATLHQAIDTMRAQTTEAVWIYQRSASSGKRILHGILTRGDIERFSLAGLMQPGDDSK